MGRGGQSLARVAVIVRAGAVPLWWLGVLATGIGLLLPGLTGRRIGLYAGAALFVVVAAVVALVRRGRYRAWADRASRAARYDYLQDRAVTLRNWRRAHRWWLLAGFLVAVGSSFALPGAGGRGRRAVAQGGLAGPPGAARRGAAVGTDGLGRDRTAGRQAGEGVPDHGPRGRRRGPRRGASPPPLNRYGR
ncbi:hypothetical protein GCM10009654_40180 [Streptomyces hebeiensis]|uniref:Guanylate cyclase domain-containing protein n=1 Tax=Streptomyces hebeiensis TaxID=229486 RepID=A0ABN1UZL8_9ACTN